MKKGDPEVSNDEKAPTCGIVMPISAWGAHDAQHWLEVKEIIFRSIEAANLVPKPVWQSAETDIIQSRIVKNLYECDMVVCDISALNPNVMFELGMRLTFKKPVVIVADKDTRLPVTTHPLLPT